MILETGSMLKDNLWLGAGLGGYQTTVAPYHWNVLIFTNEAGKLYEQPVEIYLYPHNIFFNFWSELGFLGMIAMITLIFITFWQSFINWWKTANDDLLIAGLALLVLFIHGLVDVPFFKNDLAFLFFFVIAANYLLSPEAKTIPAAKV
jgi:O-antigen ligase